MRPMDMPMECQAIAHRGSEQAGQSEGMAHGKKGLLGKELGGAFAEIWPKSGYQRGIGNNKINAGFKIEVQHRLS
ncbi:hypothetical protein FMM01_11730 [Schleiferilactobacillus harbinensis]|uniref:hypothetical protein n=1 Tax=Schleiferilactobacillus harbinensis TaxID=304207 RepID=UPI0012392415|nr:hypothetical protein [Schleiferilactobacillus harbinensis]QEU47920.1 hypothetical protein FMM01_11730 [Schleiferilactobacillus harbinensis]